MSGVSDLAVTIGSTTRDGPVASQKTVLRATQVGSAGAFRRAGVRIDVELREIARRDVEPDAMTGLEQVGGGEGLDADARRASPGTIGSGVSTSRCGSGSGRCRR